MIAKKKNPGPKSKGAHKLPKNRFPITQILDDKQAQRDAESKSNGQFNGQTAPRVGDDKKKGTVKVIKPSRVQSGIALKKKKGLIKRML
jgi:hypothetical protein